MTSTKDYRKLSLLPDFQGNVIRSQSDTSYEGFASIFKDKRGRRSSEWTTREDKMVLRPLQLDHQHNYSGLLYRRLSRSSKTTTDPTKEASVTYSILSKSFKTTTEQPTKENGVTRSNSILSKFTKTATETAKEASVNRSHSSRYPKTEPSKENGVTRSYSMKSVKKLAEARQRHRGSSIPTESKHHQYGGKVKERTISNRSLPLPGDESEYLRLRNFSVTSKGVVNRGDSFRSRSSPKVEEEVQQEVKTEQPSPLRGEDVPQRRPFRVLLAGAAGVGKSSMWKQFMTSEYICADDFGNDREMDRVITVVLNSEESSMEFEEETLHEENAFYLRDGECDAYVIVYSVTDRRSYNQARHLLALVERVVDARAVILVGNKTDLARLRAVTTEEGRSLAKSRGCKFIETSVAINHQLDELLVGALTQIRIKTKQCEEARAQQHKHKHGKHRCSKATGLLKSILRRACLRSKSCDNLHVL